MIEEKGEQQEALQFTGNDLSAFEHCMIGSTAMFDGKPFGSENLIQMMDSKSGIDTGIFQPVSVREENKNVSDVSRAREKKRFMSGMLSLFGVSQIDLFDEGLKPGFELSPADEVGNTKPKWRFMIFDKEGNEVTDSEKLEKLELDELFEKFLDKEIGPGGNYLTFKLSLKKE